MLSVTQTSGLVGFGSTGSDYSKMKVGIGTLPSLSNTWNLTIHSNNIVSVVTQYTNPATGSSQNSGFVTGVESTGQAIIQQNESGKNIFFLNRPSGTLIERMHINDNGYVGVGDFLTTGINPLRKLEVYDGGGSPQFRLTYTQNSSANLGIHSEFQTTSAGNLMIDTRNGSSDMSVGVGDPSEWGSTTPSGKLEVIDGSGDPQLRLTATYATGNNNYTDFTTVATGGSKGNLNITPKNGEVGINKNPNAFLDVKGSNGTEQLRLSYDNTTNYTQFITNSSGYLNINPTGGRLGIGSLSSTPGYTLHVFGTAAIDNVPSTSSYSLDGLVWDPTTHQVEANPNVVYLGGCSGSTFYLPKYNGVNSICPGLLYDNGSNIGLGITSGFSGFMHIYQSSTSGSNNGLYVKNNTTGGSGISGLGSGFGVSASAFGTTPFSDGSAAIGVTSSASSSSSSAVNIAYYGSTTPTSSGNYNFGSYMINSSGTPSEQCSYYGTATNGTLFNYGINVNATSSSSTSTNYGVYAQSGGGFLSYGVYGSCAGSSNFAIYANGNAGGTSSWNPSDSKLKSGIVPLTDGLTSIMKLKPSTYFFDTLDYHFMNLPGTLQYGLIAEDVSNVLPSLVGSFNYPDQYDSSGKQIGKAFSLDYLNYIGLIPILISAVQQLSSTVDSLEQQINLITNKQVTGENSRQAGHSQDVELKDNNSIVLLDQNYPNPFADNTVIHYFIPEGMTNVQIIFYDNSGNIIRMIPIHEVGEGQLNVFAGDLSNGIYTYSIIASGKVLETKKMIKQK